MMNEYGRHGMRETNPARATNRRVNIRKYMGDDEFSWALFIDGDVKYSGMDHSEALWRRRVATRNLAAGRRWDQDACGYEFEPGMKCELPTGHAGLCHE